MYHPTLEEVERLAGRGNLVPVYRELSADLETPVSAYLKVARGPYSYLLESVEGGERVARYSFIGTDPQQVVKPVPASSLERSTLSGRSRRCCQNTGWPTSTTWRSSRRGRRLHLLRRRPVLRAPPDARPGPARHSRVSLHAVDHLPGLRPRTAQDQGRQPRRYHLRRGQGLHGGDAAYRRHSRQAPKPCGPAGARSRPAHGRRSPVQHDARPVRPDGREDPRVHHRR